MRRLALLAIAGAALGCSGTLGHDSPTQVRLESNGSTTDLSTIHVIISPNNGSSLSANAVSDVQSQSWATTSSGASFKEIDFTTNSNQTPYFVYIENGATAQGVKLRILMDGNEKYNHDLTLNPSATVQEDTIFRNNVQTH